MDFRGVMAIAVVVAPIGCGQIGKEAKQELPPEFRPPSATEVFTLRTKCGELATKLESDMAHGPAIAQDVTSRYDPKTNRCYALITTRLIDPKHGDKVGSYLYDAQTKNLLAFATREGTKTGSWNFVTGEVDYTKVTEWIAGKMKEDYR